MNSTSLSPQRAYQPGELVWRERSTADITRFLKRQPLVAEDPHAEHVLLESAAILWECRAGTPSWAGLPVRDIFRRLRIDQQYFPDPALVVAHFEVLHAFVNWLVGEKYVSVATGDFLADEIMQARSPLVECARRTLKARREALEKQGAWHEVLKTMKR